MKLFTVDEVSKILRVTPKSVRDFINSGQLKASKIGAWKIREDDLLEFIRSRSNTASGPLQSAVPEQEEQAELGELKAHVTIHYYTDDPMPLVTKMTGFIKENKFQDITWQYTYDEKSKHARFEASGEPRFLKSILELVEEQKLAT